MKNLASKYRPNKLSDVVGQSTIVKMLNSMCSKEDLESRNFLLVGPAGVGKAQPLSSNVLTEHGYKHMGDIKVGDVVFTHSGCKASVHSIYPQGKRNIFKIILNDNSSIRVADNHLNLYYTLDSMGKFTPHVEDTLSLIKHFKSDTERFYIPYVVIDYNNYDNGYSSILSDDGYVYGLILANQDINFSSDVYDLFANKISDIAKLHGISYSTTWFDDIISNISNYNNSSDEYTAFYDYIRDLCRTSIRFRENVIYGVLDYCRFRYEFYQDIPFHDFYASKLFSDIVRSIGLVDIVNTRFDYDANMVVESHHVNFDTLKSKVYQNRYITDIVYDGYEDCQCLYIDHEDHTYISDNFIPTHNTTIARSIANLINDGYGEPIEIDAASHSGVDAMQEIVDQARVYPMGSKYKVFILDECFSPETKILTDHGYKRIDALNNTDKIAQYHEEGYIDFVSPIRYIKKPYSGEMIRLFPTSNSNYYVDMTPNHIQPMFDVNGNKVGECEAKHINEYQCKHHMNFNFYMKQDSNNSGSLSNFTRIAILLYLYREEIIEDGTTYYVIKIPHSFLNHLYYIRKLLMEADVRFHTIPTTTNCDVDAKIYIDIKRVLTSFRIYLSDSAYELKVKHFLFNKLSDIMDTYGQYITKSLAKEIVDYIMYLNELDMHIPNKSNNFIYFSNESDRDVFAMLATCAGYHIISSNFMHNGSNLYAVELCNNVNMSMESFHSVTFNYTGNVYCVEVPTHMIIVQANGLPFVSGNCHAISSAGWQKLLKTLEESPAKSVFILCTTNFEKIPNTILSRVQAFHLSRLSSQDILNRLEYIIQEENTLCRGITYDEPALLYIAKLADGGMRDAITLLEKTLSYSNEITMDNVVGALNLSNYDTFFSLLKSYTKKDVESVFMILDSVYNSGVNFVQWINEFQSFLVNVSKYIYLKDINKTMIPSTYESYMQNYGAAHAIVCLKLSNTMLKCIQEIKYSSYPLEVATSYLSSGLIKKQ